MHDLDHETTRSKARAARGDPDQFLSNRSLDRLRPKVLGTGSHDGQLQAYQRSSAHTWRCSRVHDSEFVRRRLLDGHGSGTRSLLLRRPRSQRAQYEWLLFLVTCVVLVLADVCLFAGPGTPPPTVLGIITFKHLGYALFYPPRPTCSRGAQTGRPPPRRGAMVSNSLPMWLVGLHV